MDSTSARLGSARLGSARLGSARLARRASFLSAALTASLTGGCSDASGDGSSAEVVAKQQAAFSHLAVERVIPVRIVEMANDCTSPTTLVCGRAHHVPPAQNACSACSDGGADCGPDTADRAEILSAFDQANWALKSLGVQVRVRSIEKYKMPLFTEILHINDPVCRPH